MPNASIAEIEVAAVKANAERWHAHGEELILANARQRYEVELKAWQAFQAAHPDAIGWRTKPQSRSQQFLVLRMTERLGIGIPLKMNRGEAHDTIEQQGGNLRLRAVAPGDAPEQGALL